MPDFVELASASRRAPSYASVRLWLKSLLGAYAVVQCAILAGLAISHWRFPLFLETMEGVVLQHAVRAAEGLSIYPRPSLDFVPLAYAPLYYLISSPLIWIFGPELAALRVVATAGYAVAIWATYAAVRDQTRSAWWGFMGAGLLAAAYATMDAYLDTAHSDSWLLASVLTGTLIAGRAGTQRHMMLGIGVLCCAFWFKQHGALFAGAGLVFLTFRHGIRASLPSWCLAIALGPVLYTAAPLMFGPDTHRFTFEVPGGWSTFSVSALKRLAMFIALAYPALLISAAYEYGSLCVDRLKSLSIWHVQGAAALASGLMAALDTGGAHNTYIPLGTFVIILGVCGLARLERSAGQSWLTAVPLVLTALAFSSALYDPRIYVTPSDATRQYAKLVEELKALDGPVASLSLGQLPSAHTLAPAMLWVAIDDLARGPRARPANARLALTLIDDMVARPAPNYLLMNAPLSGTWYLDRLAPHYTLERDFETRFAALAGLPGTYEARASFPRFLYRRTTDVRTPPKD
jgi:hypothetical protein